MKFDYYLCKNHSLNNMYVKDKENQIYRLMMDGNEWSVKKSNNKMDTHEFYKSIDYSKKVFQKMIQKGGDQMVSQLPYDLEEEINNTPREAMFGVNQNIMKLRNETIFSNQRRNGNIQNEFFQSALKDRSQIEYKELKKLFNQIHRTFSSQYGLLENKISLPLVLNENYIDINDHVFQGNTPLIQQRKANAQLVKIYYQMVIQYIYYYFNDVYNFLYYTLQENDQRKKQNEQKQEKKSFFSWRKKPIKNIYNEDYVIEMQVKDRGINTESINNSLPIDDPRRRIVFKFNNTELSLNFIVEFLKRSQYPQTLEGLLKFKNDIDNKFERERYYRQKYGNE